MRTEWWHGLVIVGCLGGLLLVGLWNWRAERELDRVTSTKTPRARGPREEGEQC